MTHSGPDGAPSWSDWQAEDDPREAEAEPGPIYLIPAPLLASPSVRLWAPGLFVYSSVWTPGGGVVWMLGLRGCVSGPLIQYPSTLSRDGSSG